MLKAVSSSSGAIGATEVTAAAVLAANQVVVGDDGSRGVKTANATSILTLNTGTLPTPITGTALQLIGADSTIGRLQVNSFGAIAAVSVTRANGTAASPTAVVNNDQIGGFNSFGYRTSGGAAYSGPSSSVQSFATENWTSTANGTKVVIATTPNLSTTLTTALTINQDQSVSIGSAGTQFLSSAATASTQFGAIDAAVAVAQTTRVQSVVAGTAAANGANWTLIGSLPTGTGTSGDIIFQTGIKTGSGTTQGTPTTALTLKGETQTANFAGQVGAKAGSGSTFSFVEAGTTTGINFRTGSAIDFWINNASLGTLSSGQFELSSTQVFSISSGTSVGAGSDVNLNRLSPGMFQIGTIAANALGSLNLTNLTASGDVTFSTAAKGPILKQGANGRVGTFVANGATPVTVTNSSVAITDTITISLNTVGGTGPVIQPFVATITAGVGFTTAANTGDTSTYNYSLMKNAA